jgi:hypothetical protein
MDSRTSLVAIVKIEPDAEDFSDPRLSQLLAWWHERCDGARLPPASAIDPLELRFILGWLMVIEPIEDGADFRYRLYGSSIVEIMGWDLTGRRVSDTFPEVAGFFCDVYRAGLRHRRPILTRHTPPRAVLVAQWERLVLPFAGPARGAAEADWDGSDGRVARFLVGTTPLGRRHAKVTRYSWPVDGDPIA